MTTQLSDYNEQGMQVDENACNCKKPCGCNSGAPPIIVNVDSNNREGYNTLNPGSIVREKTAYPVSAQVVNPQVVQPGVYTTAQAATAIAQSEATSPTGTKQATPLPTKANPLVVVPKKKRVFFPEFL